jgi:hypothetical protein
METAQRGDADPTAETSSETAPSGTVTYTIRVLSSLPDEDGRPVRRVLFSRTAGGEMIEIHAETDAANLLAELPDLLDAAMAVQASLPPAARAPRRPGHAARLAEESRRLRQLAQGDAPRRRVLQLIGMAYQARGDRPGLAAGG